MNPALPPKLIWPISSLIELDAIATPCGLLVLLLVFDWRLGLLSLVPVALGFLIMMSNDRATDAGKNERIPKRAG